MSHQMYAPAPYQQSGLIYPEALVAGEAAARAAGQFSGMGSMGSGLALVDDGQKSGAWKGCVVGACGLVLGGLGGFFLARWIYNSPPPSVEESMSE